MVTNRSAQRRITAGTWTALLLTAAVLVFGGAVLHRLRGSGSVTIRAVRTAETLELPQQPAVQAGTERQPQAPQPPARLESDYVNPAAEEAFTLTIGGTVTVSSELRKNSYYNESKKYDFTEVLAQLTPSLQGDVTALAFDNLIYPRAKLSDNVTAAETLQMLTSAGVDLALMGYSKVYDQGEEGLAATVEAMNAQGLAVAGSVPLGEDGSCIMSVGGIRVAFLHYGQSLSKTGNTKAKKTGNGSLPKLDAERITREIAEMRSKGAGLVVVTVHWNKIKDRNPTRDQKQVMNQIAAAGADICLGMGQTPVQSAEWLENNGRRTLCFYSLGQLVCTDRSDADVAGALAHIQVKVGADGPVIDRVSVTPTYIWRFKQDSTWHYLVLPSGGGQPDGMDETQQRAMNSAFGRVQKAMESSGFPLQ